MKLHLKVKASALQFAIFVSVIVAILLSTFLLLTYSFSSFSNKSQQVLSNIHSSSKGIQSVLHNELDFGDSLITFIDETPVVLHKSYLGGYNLISSIAGVDKNKFNKIALLGTRGKGEIVGMYLQDNHLPLVLAGNTKIEGEVYSPGDLIKPGNISGNYYSGNKLIYGSRFSSKNFLPVLDSQWLEYILKMQGYSPGSEEEVVQLESIKNSFFDNRKVIYSTEKLVIDQQLIGNIIIKSEIEIEITSFSSLNQVVVIAPKVLVNSDFKGNLHIISEEVKIGENTHFQYPSSITVVKKKSFENENTNEENSKINFGSNSVFQGNIVFLSSEVDDKSRNHIIIGTNAIVEGNIYCEGYTELKGTVIGSIYTKYFVANEFGSSYINHIYNGKILTETVKDGMAGLPFDGEFKAIAAWLY